MARLPSRTDYRVSLDGILFGLAIILSTASKLRLPGLPLGIGEVIIFVWLVPNLLKILYRMRVVRKWEMTIVALMFSYLLCNLAGTTINAATTSINYDSLVHSEVLRNFAAITVAMSLAVVFCLSLKSFKKRMNGIALCGISYISICTLLYYTHPNIVVYSDYRLTGMSENPNQFALVIILFMAVMLQRIIESRRDVVAYIGMIISVWAGILTRSDALVISLVMCSFTGAIYIMISSLSSRRNRIIGILVATFSGIGLLILNSATIAKKLAGVSADQGNQGEGRIVLWEHGLAAWKHSPAFGLGPVSLSGIAGPFEHTESHNTYIDVLSQGGMGALAVILLIALLSFRSGVGNRCYGFVIGLAMLMVFCLFHYMIRQPIFWLTLLLPYAYSYAHSREEDASGTERELAVLLNLRRLGA